MLVHAGQLHPQARRPDLRNRWWPRHPLGWDHTFVHEMAHFLEAVAGEHEVAPCGATFEDGYRPAAVCDAILASAECGSWVKIEY